MCGLFYPGGLFLTADESGVDTEERDESMHSLVVGGGEGKCDLCSMVSDDDGCGNKWNGLIFFTCPK